MTKKLFFVSLIVSIVSMHWSCNKATDLTSFLDDSLKKDITYDEIPFHAKTINGDSSVTFDDSTFIPSFFAGAVNDPFFGTAIAQLNFQVGIFTEPNFSGSTLDSIVLSVEYDTTRRSYGQLHAPLSFEVYELDQDISINDTYYSSSRVAVKAQPIGEIEGLIPNFDDTVLVVEPQIIRLDTVSYVPHLRIRLDDALGATFLQYQQSDFASVDIFLKKFKGLSLRPKPSCEGMVFFELFNGLTRINLYYTQRDTSRLMQFPVLSSSSLAFNTYEHLTSGSVVESVIQDPSEDDPILYVQSMQGSDIRIEFSDLESIKSAIINFAELQLNLAVPNGDDTAAFTPIKQFILQELQDDNRRVDIIDLTKVGGNNIPLYFGGDLEVDRETNVTSYKFNITKHLQKIVAGTASKKMILSSIYKGAEPNRSIFFGNSDNPLSAKIKVTHTNTN